MEDTGHKIFTARTPPVQYAEQNRLSSGSQKLRAPSQNRLSSGSQKFRASAHNRLSDGSQRLIELEAVYPFIRFEDLQQPWAKEQLVLHEETTESSIEWQPDYATFKPGYRFYLAFSSLTVLAMMVSLDGTSVSVALPIMADDLRGNTIEVFWTGTSYLLSSSVFLLPMGALSHIFGRTIVLNFCTLCFMAGIITSAVANNYTVMLLGRTIQGVGGGGIILLNDIIMTDLVPLRLRGLYSGVIGGVWALGSVTGPVIGGALATKASWRWIFWINVPFAVLSLIMVSFFLRLAPLPGSATTKLRRVDWLGNFLLVASTTSFLIPITWGNIQYPWSSWHTLVPMILGILGIAFFCFYELHFATEPTIRLHFLGSYNMAYSMFATFVNALIVYGALYFLPLYYEVVKGYGPIVAGVALFPATFTIAPVSIITGIIITKTGDFRVITWIGWGLATLGCGVSCMLDVDTTIVQWIFLTLVPGIGLGVLYTSLSFVNQSASDEASVAFAVSLFVFFRSLGQCVGVAIGGAAFSNQMLKHLQSIPGIGGAAAQLSRDTFSLATLIKTLPEASEERIALVKAFADSLRVVWMVMCALCGAALLGSFFVKKVDLDRKHETNQRLVENARANAKGNTGSNLE